MTVRYFAILLAATSCNSINADIIQVFQTDTTAGFSQPSVSSYTRSLTGLVADGVTFDALLTVTGSGTLNVGSSGLGVEGNTTDLVNNGESLTVSMALSGFVGGTVAFNGFEDVDFNSFGASDEGVLSLDADAATLGDNFFSTTTGAGNVDISTTAPTSFSAIAGLGAGTANSFRIDDVTARFTGTAGATAVPEPSSATLLVSLGAILAYRGRRRRQ